MRHVIKLWAVTVLTAFTLSIGNANANPSDIKQLHKDIRILIKTENTHNDRLHVSYMWPELLDIVGGKEKLLKVVAELRKNNKEKGRSRKFSNLKFHKKPKFYRAGPKKFAVVPFLVTVKQTAPVKTSRVEMYYLGIKDHRRARWTYVDGYFFVLLNVREYIQDFPPQAVLPRPKVISQK